MMFEAKFDLILLYVLHFIQWFSIRKYQEINLVLKNIIISKFYL